ncbi:MAG: NAD-binding protein [Clostridiales bacterium]|nr:NAD-binding protein [Candidatus Crickella caballi]
MKMLVMGGGKVGRAILENPGFADWDITVIEKNPEVAAYIEQNYDVMVVEGDQRDYLLLEDCDVKNMDAVISATSSDEMNILSGLYAKKRGARYAAVRFSDMLYDTDFMDFVQNDFDVDLIFNPSSISAERIINGCAGDEGAEHIKSVVLVGAGRTALYLTQLFLDRGYSVTAVVDNDEAGKDFADRVDDRVSVICDNDDDRHILETIDVSGEGAFVAVTNSESLNVMLAKYADNAGVPYTAALVSHNEIAELGKALGIDEIISPRDVSDHVTKSLQEKNIS